MVGQIQILFSWAKFRSDLSVPVKVCLGSFSQGPNKCGQIPFSLSINYNRQIAGPILPFLRSSEGTVIAMNFNELFKLEQRVTFRVKRTPTGIIFK